MLILRPPIIFANATYDKRYVGRTVILDAVMLLFLIVGNLENGWSSEFTVKTAV